MAALRLNLLVLQTEPVSAAAKLGEEIGGTHVRCIGHYCPICEDAHAYPGLSGLQPESIPLTYLTSDNVPCR